MLHPSAAVQRPVPRFTTRVGCGPRQVLYTLPVDRSDPDSALIGESGAMNVFFLLDKVPHPANLHRSLASARSIFLCVAFMRSVPARPGLPGTSLHRPA